MPIYSDQAGRIVDLPGAPARIVSLVPSLTELLYALGLDKEVAGITKFCVHPEKWFREKTRVGGTKTVKRETIRQLHPDLVIANKEENVKEQIEALAQDHPVWVTDVNNLAEARVMMEQIGSITGTSQKAAELVNEIDKAFATLPALPPLPAAYLIWRDPYMTVSGDTFIHDMLARCGFQNVFGHATRYPAVTIEELRSAGCQVLLLSSEPYPFKQQHLSELQAALPGTQVLLVDGELFSWYGSRLLHAPSYFAGLLRQVRAMS